MSSSCDNAPNPVLWSTTRSSTKNQAHAESDHFSATLHQPPGT